MKPGDVVTSSYPYTPKAGVPPKTYTVASVEPDPPCASGFRVTVVEDPRNVRSEQINRNGGLDMGWFAMVADVDARCPHGLFRGDPHGCSVCGTPVPPAAPERTE